jgi:hypothetical protein
MKRITLVVLFMTGCAVGPTYRPPTAAIPAAYKEPLPASFKANLRLRSDQGDIYLLAVSFALGDTSAPVYRLSVRGGKIFAFEMNYQSTHGPIH